jgi:hypothetical protein
VSCFKTNRNSGLVFQILWLHQDLLEITVVSALNYDVINMDGELERNAEEIVANLNTAGIKSLVFRFAIGLTALYVSTCFEGLPYVCFVIAFFIYLTTTP